MLFFSGTMYANVVSNVPHIMVLLKDLPNYMLGYLRAYSCSIWQTFVPAEANMCI